MYDLVEIIGLTVRGFFITLVVIVKGLDGILVILLFFLYVVGYFTTLLDYCRLLRVFGGFHAFILSRQW